MKKFEFKLQPLLSYRRYLEKIAQQKIASAQMDIKKCEENIIELKQVWGKNVDKIEKVVKKGVNATVFRQYQNYLFSVETNLKNEKIRKIELNKILKEKLLVLKKKSIDKKVMALYKKKLKAEDDHEIIKIEQKVLDETVSLKTARRISNETI